MNRNLLFAATRCPRTAANISALCLSVTKALAGLFMQRGSVPAFRRELWWSSIEACDLPLYQSGGEKAWAQTRAVMKRCEWVEPVLVAQIKFTEWTDDDQLRQPVFLRLRSDKPAMDVVREAG
jgi:ATP dependent DNA ligase-like protein